MQRNWFIAGATLLNRIVYHFVALFSRAGLLRAIRNEISSLDASPHPRKIMNVGAGGKLGSAIAAMKNGEVVEVDLDAERRPDVVADVCNLTCFEQNSFDAVFLMEVLEHVQNPQLAMDEIWRVLRPGGLVMLSAPFVFEIHAIPHDYYRFTRFGLAHLCQRFEDVRIQARNGYIFAMLVPGMRLIMSDHWTDVLLGWAFSLATLVLWPAIWLLDRCVRSDAITSGYIVRATKPGISRP